MEAFWGASQSQSGSQHQPSGLSSSAPSPARKLARSGGSRFQRRQPTMHEEESEEEDSEDDDVRRRSRPRKGGRSASSRSKRRPEPEEESDDGSEDESDGGRRGRSRPGARRPARRINLSGFRRKKPTAKPSSSSSSSSSSTQIIHSSAGVRRQSVAVGTSPGFAVGSGGLGTHNTPHARRVSVGAAPDFGGGYGMGDGLDGMDDGMGGGTDDEDEEDEEEEASPSPQKPKAGSKAKGKAAAKNKAKGKAAAKGKAKSTAGGRGRKKQVQRRRAVEDDSGDDSGDDGDAAAPRSSSSSSSSSSSAAATPSAPVLSPGGTDLRRVRKSIHPSEAELAEAAALGVRRSSRRRWNPLEFWKGEHVEYRRGRSDEVFSATRAVKEGVLTPDTVKVRKSRTKRSRAAGKKQPAKRGTKRSKAAGGEDDDDEEEEEQHGVSYPAELPRASLPKSVHVTAAAEELFRVAGRDGHPDHEMCCVRRDDDIEFRPLPNDDDAVTDPAARAVGMRSAAEAGAALETHEFIAGTIRIPPLSQKDEESAGNCVQIFAVIAAQPRAVHVTMADKGFLLSPGDHFFVPHNTPYRIRNFSEHTAARITFTLLKPSEADAAE